MSREIVESDKVPDHTNSFVEWAVAIVRRISVLLQDVILQQLGHLKSDLVSLGQRCLAYELDNFQKIFFLLQDLVNLCSERNKVGEVLVIVVVESVHVLGIGDQPVHQREVLTLSKFFVETPENLKTEN